MKRIPDFDDDDNGDLGIDDDGTAQGGAVTIPKGILLDDNNLSAVPGLDLFPSSIRAISLKRNNISMLPLYNWSLNSTQTVELWLDLSENSIESLPAQFISGAMSTFQYV